MKKTFTIIFTIFLFVLFLNTGNSQNPTYSLRVSGMALNTPFDNELEFDIYLLRTGATSFEYARGRCEFFFNPLIANGGTLTYTVIGGSSGLLPAQQPNSTTVTGNELSMAYEPLPGAGNGTIISNIFPGTKIGRMKLVTSAPSFALQPLALEWNNPGSPSSPRTRMFAYIGGTSTQITTPPTHIIDSSGLGGGVLPVELTNFTSTISRNSVSLNWTTVKESNNSGFDIERKQLNSEWQKISFIEGNGTTNNTSEYSFVNNNLQSGGYFYRLKQIDFNGNYEYYNLNSEIKIGSPENFSLSQNYPNPFNPSTVINFEIPFDGNVNLGLYDMSGREVKSLVYEFKPAGYYTINLNGTDLPSGTYFYRITSEGNGNNFNAVKKMMLIK